MIPAGKTKRPEPKVVYTVGSLGEDWVVIAKYAGDEDQDGWVEDGPYETFVEALDSKNILEGSNR
jgi:hypothetical protein